MRKRTQEIFEQLDVHVDPKAIMSTLPVSQRQMVEIAKAGQLRREDHRVRRAHLLPDGGGGGAPVPHHQYAAGARAAASFTSATRWRRSSASATRSPSCGTVSGWPPGRAKDLTMEEIIKLMVGRELTNRFPPKDQ